MEVEGVVNDGSWIFLNENFNPKNNEQASRIYHIAEILQRPLNFLCDGIIAREKTVLTPGKFGNCESKILEIARRVLLAFMFFPVAGVVLVSYPLGILLNYMGDLTLDEIKEVTAAIEEYIT